MNVIYDDMELARLLDLALAIAPDGLSAELTERAPEGTTLMAPAALRQSAEDARMDCERELARDPSATHGGGERTPLWMVDHTSAGATCKTVRLPGYPRPFTDEPRPWRARPSSSPTRGRTTTTCPKASKGSP